MHHITFVPEQINLRTKTNVNHIKLYQHEKTNEKLFQLKLIHQ